MERVLWVEDHYERLSTPPSSIQAPAANESSALPQLSAIKTLTAQLSSTQQRLGPRRSFNTLSDKMKTSLLFLLLLSILHTAAAFPTDRRREKHASWDDVNVVAHGLLQLGQGLKEHVDKTKAQMRDVFAKLKAFNGTMAELERRQMEGGQGIRSRDMEERGRLLEELAREVREKVEEVKKQGEDIRSRMDRLEGKVEEVTVDSNNSDHTGLPLIQVRGKHHADSFI